MKPELFIKDADGSYIPTTIESEAQAWLNRLAKKREKWQCVDGPDSTIRALRTLLADEEIEKFGVLYLNQRNFIIGHAILFTGTVDGCSVHPREVIKASLNAGANAIILFHNHPSGVSEPSHADEVITRRLKQAAGLFDMRVLDHIVVSSQGHTSFAERGLLT